MELLPCGEEGILDGVGMRCQACFLIYGSVAWIGSSCPSAVTKYESQKEASEKQKSRMSYVQITQDERLG